MTRMCPLPKNTHRINVTHATGNYEILIGQNILDTSIIEQFIRGTQVMIISNPGIAQLYQAPILEKLKAIRKLTTVLTHEIPAGEDHKTLAEVEQIWNRLAENNFHRDSALIALGGGVVGDMVGFAAACYHRGIHFIQIPTSLLAMTDASIGGKTAVDHPMGKNLIGAFHQPKAVIVDISVLKTLPEREFLSGMSEVVKHGLIGDPAFFQWLEQNMDGILAKHDELLTEMLRVSCGIKATIVSEDERETSGGRRAHLNLGHTFGHAIEQQQKYKDWLHGEAVGFGVILAADISHRKGWISHNETDRITRIFQKLQMPSKLPANVQTRAFLSTLWSDKKVINNKLNFILLDGIGKAVVTEDLSEEYIAHVLLSYI